MDMKRILQAMDEISTKPVGVLNEGASPHKVALPVQMTMQHYQQKEIKPSVKKDSLLKKYFEQVEEFTLQELANRKQLIQQYAQKVSQRVLEGSYYRRPDAYDRDYQSSIAGMGRQSRREVDDEANIMYRYDDASGRLKQKMIDVRDERDAKAQGFRYEQKDALRVANIIRSKFDPNKFIQKQGNSWVEVYPFGKKEPDNKETKE